MMAVGGYTLYDQSGGGGGGYKGKDPFSRSKLSKNRIVLILDNSIIYQVLFCDKKRFPL